MPRRTRTYVAFDADSDINMYRLMQAWEANDNIDFDFNNAHDVTTIRPDSGTEAIKRSLRERMANSKIFVLLVGKKTRLLRKYVPWEIEIALKAGLPIIVVNLEGKGGIDRALCPTVLHDQLAIHISFGPAIMQTALDSWPNSHQSHRQTGESGPYQYKNDV